MQQSRYAQCLLWLLLAAVVVVALDDRPAMSMEIPTLAQVADISTSAGSLAGGDTTADHARLAGEGPIDLTPADGYPLTFAERDSIVRLALALVGVPYHLGGTNPERGFDCSGFVGYVLSRMRLPVPRLAYQQGRVGRPVARDLLQAGDLLTFGADSISHVGIYIGNGRFVHASSVARRVIVSPLDRPPSRLVQQYHGARRLLVAGTATTNGA